MNRYAIMENLDVSYYHTSKPKPMRKRKNHKRIKEFLKYAVATIVMIIIFELLFFVTIVMPNSRDNYENNKNTYWQEKVSEYQKENGR